MSSQAGPSNFVLTRRLADGTVEWVPLDTPQRVPAGPGEHYALIDRADYEAPQALVARRQGDDLVVEVQGTEVVVLDGFFATEDAAFHPTTDIAGGAGPFAGTPLTPDSPVLPGSPQGEQVVWSAEPAGDEQVARAGEDAEGDGGSPLLYGGLAAGGLGLALAAGGGGGGGSDDGPPDAGGTEDPAPEPTTVEGSIVVGPVIEGNGLSVEVFEADGTTLIGEAEVTADGSFSIDAGDYTGALIVRVVDADDGDDYLDEASGANRDLNAALGAVQDVDELISTVSVNVNPLTTLAAALADREAEGGALTPEQVARGNAAIASVFGLPDLHATTVEPINGGGFDTSDDVSAEEVYGAILAAFSGATLNNGGDGQATIDEVLAGLSLSESGEATLSDAAQALLIEGAQTIERETGESISDIVVSALDSLAPEITSGDTADEIPENSGAGQVVYTATATDAGAVAWSLAGDGDAAAFSIDADTGAVTLTENPDFETKSSYTFTVVATDAAGNSAEQTVSLAIADQDDSVPFITSGAIATPIDENSGDDQVVYTATATDDNGSVTWGLEDGGDSDAFDIDEETGEVTLDDDPDHETQDSYTFTVVATDEDGNSSRQTVSLEVNDLDEVAPTITSGETAESIEEQSGAGQVVYTVTSTDDEDISTGTTTYSLSPEDDAADFEIDADTGEVILIENPDYETKSSYEFTVVATDEAGNSSKQTVELEINDLDDEPPDITSGATAEAIDENSGEGQVVYVAAADDDGPVIWSLTDDGDGADFSIDEESGEVTLNHDPDFETQDSYTFTVVATDEAGNSSEQAVTLEINDVADETPPTITSGETADAVDENSGENLVIYIAATDDAEPVTWSLADSGDAADFSIDGESGEVTLIENPDFETQPSYTFTVVATDEAGNSSEQAVTLEINDLAGEPPPTLTSSTPTDDAEDVPVGDDIVLVFSEEVLVGTGNITISDGSDIREIDVTDTSQVSVSGEQVTVNPEDDLNTGRTYSVQIDSGAFTDETGNAFAGDSLSFDTEADPSIVVFDLLQGSSSDHSNRTFDDEVSYDIYIRVDSDSGDLSTAGSGPGTWGTWSGANNLGSNDRVVLVGDGEAVQGPLLSVSSVSIDDSSVTWESIFGPDVAVLEEDTFIRNDPGGGDETTVTLFDESPPEDFFEDQEGELSTMYLTTMPANILTSQGLA